MLFECLIVFFLIDESNPYSFEIIKDLTNIINNKKYPDLRIILIQNKKEYKNEIKIVENNINEYLKLNPFIMNFELPLNDKDLLYILKVIYDEIYNSKNLNYFHSDFILESKDNKMSIIKNISMTFILVGDSPVGKSSFLNRHTKINYESFNTTIGSEKEEKYFKLGKDIINISLWDSGGQERFRYISRKYYQNSDGIFILFDVSREISFKNIPSWIKDVEEYSNGKTQIIFIIGNRIDSNERVISKESAELYAKSLGLKYFEISCKYDINIFEVIKLMIIEVYKKYYYNSYSKLMEDIKNKYIIYKNKKKKFIKTTLFIFLS